MLVNVLGRRTYPGRLFTGSDESDHGTPAALQDMAMGTTLALMYFDTLPSSDATIWSRVGAGQVYNSFRFTGTTFRRRIQTSGTAMDAQATYANLPGFGPKKWVVMGSTWNIAGPTESLALFCGTHASPLAEATAYSARNVGSGTPTGDSALSFKLGNRGGAANPLGGLLHSVYIRRDYVAGIKELRDIADAMLEQIPLDGWNPTFEAVLGKNESGPVHDESLNFLNGTVTGAPLGISPPIWSRAQRRWGTYRAPAGATPSAYSGLWFTR